MSQNGKSSELVKFLTIKIAMQFAIAATLFVVAATTDGVGRVAAIDFAFFFVIDGLVVIVWRYLAKNRPEHREEGGTTGSSPTVNCPSALRASQNALIIRWWWGRSVFFW
jgi:hypothetical protein